MEIFGMSIVTVETEVANFENDKWVRLCLTFEAKISVFKRG